MQGAWGVSPTWRGRGPNAAPAEETECPAKGMVSAIAPGGDAPAGAAAVCAVLATSPIGGSTHPRCRKPKTRTASLRQLRDTTRPKPRNRILVRQARISRPRHVTT